MTRTVPPDVTDLALACVADAIAADERPGHFRLLHRLFTTAVRERRELPDGRAFRFDADALGDLARWIDNERRCCPFLAFGLELGANGGPIWLRLTGPDGTHAFLDAELPAGVVSPGRDA